MRTFVLNSRRDLIEAVRYFGFLPFFANEITGFSIEEMTPAERWFTSIEGPWEWKGPVISEGDCVYGKFFNRKAGFVSNRWFPDFANVRRDGYDYEARVEDGLASYADQYLYDIIAKRHSILSKDAKIAGGYVKPPHADGRDSWQPRKGFDTSITRLQMQCYVIISDFEYEMSKAGEFYGWGIARYAIPEEYPGKRKFTDRVYRHTTEESRKRILKHLHSVLPETEKSLLERLLRG